LLAHQNGKLLKWQNGFEQPFDRDLLEKPLMVPDNEHLLMGIDAQIHILPDPVQIHIVASFGNAYRPILADFAPEMLLMNRC
jgi:hypothetical protein